jgi:hypothetical protein
MKSSINAKATSDMFKFISKAKGTIQAVNREVLLEIGRRLVHYSAIGNPLEWKTAPYWPKGYVPGHFINNWQVGIDQKPRGVIPTIDASGVGSLERMSHLGRWTVGHTYYFANNLPYAALLETGTHSLQVGPMGMVGRVRLEFRQIVKEAEAKVTAQKLWLKESSK